MLYFHTKIYKIWCDTYQRKQEVTRVMPIGQTELIVVLLIILLLFGSSKLPELARAMGRAKGEFKKGAEAETTEEEETKGKPAPKAEAKAAEAAPKEEKKSE